MRMRRYGKRLRREYRHWDRREGGWGNALAVDLPVFEVVRAENLLLLRDEGEVVARAEEAAASGPCFVRDYLVLDRAGEEDLRDIC